MRAPDAIVPEAEEGPYGALTVLLASETYPPDANGAAYFVHRLAGALCGRGHDVHVACPGDARADDQGLRITVHRVGSWPIPGYAEVRVAPPLSAGRRLRRLAGELGPNVVHVQNHFVVGRRAIAAARDLGIPIVATNHFLPENFTAFAGHVPQLGVRAIERGLWWDLNRVYRRAGLVTAPTSYAAALTAERARFHSVVPVSCGIDLDAFAPAGEAAAFRAAYGIGERPTFLHVGRLDPDKHVDQLIAALALVRTAIDAQLVVVGRGKELDRLRRFSRSRHVEAYVHFCGFVPDHLLAGAYEAADVYCNAGTAELQSIATLEAMAAGKPVVLADAHALPLLVREGVNGYLFPAGADEPLAARLVELLSDLERCRAMGRESRAAVQAHDLESTARVFERLYRQATASAARSGTQQRSRREGPRVARGSLPMEAGALAMLLALFALPLVEGSTLLDGDERASYAVAVVATACALSLLLMPAVLRAAALTRIVPAATAAISVRAGRALLGIGLLAAAVLLGLLSAE